MKEYDYVIVGAGVVGSCIAYELSKYSQSILLIDQNSDVAQGASGAAGAFLSPLLGKPNPLKDLVTKALKYSTTLYLNEFEEYIDNCGTTRIPKNSEDDKKFQSYKPYMDFEYTLQNDGYYFKIASVVNSYGICKQMTTNKNITKLFYHSVKNINYTDKKWTIDNTIKTKNLILATGANSELLNEQYINIKGVWGCRIDVESSSKLNHNYHKECSISKSFLQKNGKYKISIGATHHREYKDVLNSEKNIQELLQKASDIVQLENIKVIHKYRGARASSYDYFPVVGTIIDAKKTLQQFPYLKDGTNVNPKRYTRYKDIYIVNGVGGRGFVLAPYLAKELVQNIINEKSIESNIKVDRLFKRYVKRKKCE